MKMENKGFTLYDSDGRAVGSGEIYRQGNVKVELCGVSHVHHFQNVGEVLFLSRVASFGWNGDGMPANRGEITLPLKPISTNKIWSGKRWMSPAAKQFKSDCRILLFSKRVELKTMAATAEEEELAISLRFGLARDMDIDNCLKLVIDSLSAVLGIDDKRFRRVSAEKEKVKRGREFISLSVSAFRARP